MLILFLYIIWRKQRTLTIAKTFTKNWKSKSLPLSRSISEVERVQGTHATILPLKCYISKLCWTLFLGGFKRPLKSSNIWSHFLLIALNLTIYLETCTNKMESLTKLSSICLWVPTCLHQISKSGWKWVICLLNSRCLTKLPIVTAEL